MKRVFLFRLWTENIRALCVYIKLKYGEEKIITKKIRFSSKGLDQYVPVVILLKTKHKMYSFF